MEPLNLNKVCITTHAVERYKERSNITILKKEENKILRQDLFRMLQLSRKTEHSNNLWQLFNNDYKEAYYYVYEDKDNAKNSIIFVISEQKVVTILPYKTKKKSTLKPMKKSNIRW